MFVFMAAASAINWVLYVDDPNPWSLFSGIFCGAMALGAFVMDLS